MVVAVGTGLVMAAAGVAPGHRRQPGLAPRRMALAGLALMLGVTAWALNGPLQPGWAHTAAASPPVVGLR